MCIDVRAPKDMAFTEELRGQLGKPVSSSLPDDVLDRIFSLLPLKEKLASRCVCRGWSSILSTESLLTYTSNTSSKSRSAGYGNACFMLTTKGPFAYALDPLRNVWHKFQKPACPGASILSAAHGLVCVGNQVSECRSLIIFNLLSSTWRLLPNMLHVGLLHKVTMAMDPVSHSYVVVVTGEDTSEFRGRRAYQLRTEVYDSVSESWRMAGDAMPDAKFGSDPGVWHNGIFYCITELPYGLTAFNLAEGRWIESSVKMPIGISSPSLASWKGQLMMVGIQDDNEDCGLCVASANSEISEFDTTEKSSKMPWSGSLQMWASLQLQSTLSTWPILPSLMSPSPSPSPLSSVMSLSPSSSPPSQSRSSALSSSPPPPPQPKKCIKVWSLSKGKHWILIDKMPGELCTELMAHLAPRTPLMCAGVGDMICITSHQSPYTVIVDLENMCWRYVASDPSFPRNRDTHLLGFAIQPDSSCVP